MLLNEKEIVELRRIIEKKLESVPEGKRIQIDTEILEQLLFDKVYVYKDEPYIGKFESPYKDENIKIVAWSGSFLSKIDLSRVDFDYVLWGYYGNYDESFYYPLYKEDKEIDLSNTNARIDFDMSARNIYDGYNAIINCNFEGVDLSKTRLDLKGAILNSNFNHTNLKFELTGGIGVCENSNLSSCDLTRIEVGEYAFGSDENGFGIFTNLNHTGLEIKLKKLPNNDDLEFRELLKLSMSLGNLDGCYLNGVLITPSNRKISIYRSFLDDIDDQVTHLQKTIK